MKAVEKFDYRRGYKLVRMPVGGFAGNRPGDCRAGAHGTDPGAYDGDALSRVNRIRTELVQVVERSRA